MKKSDRYLKVIILYSAIIVSILGILQKSVNIYESISTFQPSATRLLVVALLYWILFVGGNYIGFKVKSALTILIPLLGFILYPVYAPGIDPSDMIVTLISLMVVTIVPYTIYNPVLEVRWIWLWNICLFLSAAVGLHFAVLKVDDLESYAGFMNIFIDEPIIPFAFLGLFLFINYTIYRYQVSNYLINKEIVELNRSMQKEIELTGKQQAELRVQNDEIWKLQRDLVKMNVELEVEVKQRTKKLADMTTTLLKYGFMNSHLLRAPVARIQGLLSVWEILEREEKIGIINSSLEELNQVMELVRQIIRKKDLKSSELESHIIEYYQSRKTA